MPQPSRLAFSELAAHAVPLRALARRLVSGDLADDLAQDTLVVALTQPVPTSALGGWLRQVLRNEHRGYLRRTRRRRDREQRSAEGDTGIAFDDHAQAQILLALREAVDTLDEPYRGAVVARFLEERSAAEIARAEGCPAATVRWRVQEGLRRTRRKMDERFEGRSQWFGAVLAFAESPPPPLSTAFTKEATPMTKLALLKVLTGVAAVAATATVVWSQTATVVAQPRDIDDHAAIATVDPAGAIARAESGSHRNALGRPHPATAARELAAELPASDPPVLGGNHPGQAGGCGEGCGDEGCDGGCPYGGDGECPHADGGGCPGDDGGGCPHAGEHDGPAWVDAIVADGPVGDPMDAVGKLALPGKGTADAKVSIVVCSDFDCPFCKRATATIDRIREEYGDKVAVHWLNSPLPMHPGAGPAAAAAMAAAAQGKFWEMHDLLFARTDARDEDELVALARELGLDTARFTADMRAEATREAIAEQQRVCLGNGAQGTPSFFINGDLVVGAQPYESFKTIIDDELAQ